LTWNVWYDGENEETEGMDLEPGSLQLRGDHNTNGKQLQYDDISRVY